MVKVCANCVYFIHQLQYLLTSLLGFLIFLYNSRINSAEDKIFPRRQENLISPVKL